MTGGDESPGFPVLGDVVEQQQRQTSEERTMEDGRWKTEDGARWLRRCQSLAALSLSAPSGRASRGMGVGREEEEHGWRRRQRGRLSAPRQDFGGEEDGGRSSAAAAMATATATATATPKPSAFAIVGSERTRQQRAGRRKGRGGAWVAAATRKVAGPQPTAGRRRRIRGGGGGNDESCRPRARY